jgi:hypothetical protein
VAGGHVHGEASLPSINHKSELSVARVPAHRCGASFAPSCLCSGQRAYRCSPPPSFTQSLNDLKQASALYLARVEMLKRLQAGAETLEIARSLELLGSTCWQLEAAGSLLR